MSEIIISPYSACDEASVLPALADIFFESSARKHFANAAEKESFFFKYLGFYLEQFPELTLVAMRGKDVLGYITGSLRSDSEDLFKIQPHLTVFSSLFAKYPAHLHINLHESSRGLGVGSKLLKEFEILLRMAQSPGVHLMTSASSRNRSFYLKNGYVFEEERLFNSTGILFMGKAL